MIFRHWLGTRKNWKKGDPLPISGPRHFCSKTLSVFVENMTFFDSKFDSDCDFIKIAFLSIFDQNRYKFGAKNYRKRHFFKNFRPPLRLCTQIDFWSIFWSFFGPPGTPENRKMQNMPGFSATKMGFGGVRRSIFKNMHFSVGNTGSIKWPFLGFLADFGPPQIDWGGHFMHEFSGKMTTFWSF